LLVASCFSGLWVSTAKGKRSQRNAKISKQLQTFVKHWAPRWLASLNSYLRRFAHWNVALARQQHDWCEEQNDWLKRKFVKIKAHFYLAKMPSKAILNYFTFDFDKSCLLLPDASFPTKIGNSDKNVMSLKLAFDSIMFCLH